MTAAACSILLWISSYAVTGIGTYDGTEEGFWDRHALVVAEITAVHEIEGASKGTLDLRLSAVIATDEMVETELAVAYSNGRGSALVGFHPSVGGLYVMCLERGVKTARWSLPSGVMDIRTVQWSLSSDRITFLPEAKSAFLIDGLQDEQLPKIVDRVKEVRRQYAALHLAEKK